MEWQRLHWREWWFNIVITFLDLIKLFIVAVWISSGVGQLAGYSLIFVSIDSFINKTGYSLQSIYGNSLECIVITFLDLIKLFIVAVWISSGVGQVAGYSLIFVSIDSFINKTGYSLQSIYGNSLE